MQSNGQGKSDIIIPVFFSFDIGRTMCKIEYGVGVLAAAGLWFIATVLS